MTIQRYSTPDIRILVDPSVVQDIWLTISESDRDELITKTMEDMTVEDNGFTLTLTSEDTAKLPKGIYDTCLIQARVLFVDGSEVNSDIIQKDVGEVLKEGFMVGQRSQSTEQQNASTSMSATGLLFERAPQEATMRN